MKYEKGTFATVPVGVIKGIDPLAQVVFMWMCMHMNGEGVCFPSIGLLCRETGIKARSTIHLKIALLEELGLIMKSSRFSGNEQTSNEYQIIIENRVSIDDRGATVGQGVVRQSDGVDRESVTPQPTVGHRTIPNELNPVELKEVGAKSATLPELIEPHKSKYSPAMIEKFLNYWTQKNHNGKKELWQMQKVFDVPKRLATWASKEKDWERPKFEKVPSDEELRRKDANDRKVREQEERQRAEMNKTRTPEEQARIDARLRDMRKNLGKKLSMPA